jgi:hypothetical protein
MYFPGARQKKNCWIGEKHLIKNQTTMRRLFTLLTSLVILINTLDAQDANYWSSNYGPGGFFTPGAVVSFNGDSGVLFLNPALLAFSKRNAASISGTIYRHESFKIKDGAGKNLPLNSSDNQIVPLIVSHTVPIKQKLPFTLVYAIVNRPIIAYSATQRKEATLNALGDDYSAGNEIFIGQYSLSKTSEETSAILSAGVKLNDKWALGFTAEGLMHKIDWLLDYKSKAIQNAPSSVVFPPISSVEEFYQAESRTIGARLKAGISFLPAAQHAIGLMISSPLMHISGSGSILAEDQINDLHLSPGISINFLASSKQTKLKSRWKTPFSISGGYTYIHARGELYFAFEYFARVKEYKVISPRPETFVRPDTVGNYNTPEELKLKDARKSLTNFAIGASYRLKENLTGYLSLRSDFTWADDKKFSDEEGYIVNVSNFNNYHLQLGVNIRTKKNNLRVGLLAGYGRSKDYVQAINFDDPKESNLLIGEPGSTKATHFNIGVLIAYLYNF